MDITHDNVCSSMLSCFYSHLLSTGRPISSFYLFHKLLFMVSLDPWYKSRVSTCKLQHTPQPVLAVNFFSFSFFLVSSVIP